MKMIHIALVVLLIMIMLAPASCAPAATPAAPQQEATEAGAGYIKISATEAKGMIENEEVIIVDVRTSEEYAESRIEGALLIPHDQIRTLAPEQLPDKEAVILVYCRSGKRSELGAKDLIDLGYQNVYDFGGIIDWPYETVSGK